MNEITKKDVKDIMEKYFEIEATENDEDLEKGIEEIVKRSNKMHLSKEAFEEMVKTSIVFDSLFGRVVNDELGGDWLTFCFTLSLFSQAKREEVEEK